jgi:hypothetical protein
MPFVARDCTPLLRSKFGLPDQLDSKHPYYYRIYEHSDQHAWLTSQTYQHASETFTVEVLIVDGTMYLLERTLDPKQVENSWLYTLSRLRLYAESGDHPGLRNRLMAYLGDIIALVPVGDQTVKVSPKLELEICEPTAVARRTIEKFPQG